jgi:hypothetical protein
VRFCGSGLSTVHSAHVGQELEVHYRWHPYFGCTVRVRRVEKRATGLFLKVQGPAGVVVSMAAWMLDPVTCAGMTVGAPQVDRAALVELDQLLIDKGRNRRSPIDAAIVQEECHEDHQSTGRDTGFPTIEPVVRRKVPGGIELTGPEQGEAAAGTNPDASRRSQRRGA